MINKHCSNSCDTINHLLLSLYLEIVAFRRDGRTEFECAKCDKRFIDQMNRPFVIEEKIADD